jgi:hypothetical protein
MQIPREIAGDTTGMHDALRYAVATRTERAVAGWKITASSPERWMSVFCVSANDIPEINITSDRTCGFMSNAQLRTGIQFNKDSWKYQP